MKIKKILMPTMMFIVVFLAGYTKVNPKSQDSKIIVDIEKSSEDSFDYVYKAKNNKSKEDEIEDMINSIEFVEESEEYGYKKYSALVKNTTSSNFDSFYLEIKLINEAGATVDIAMCNADSWKSEEEVKFEFSTDVDFEKIDWEYEYYNY